jgi:hypothetical protein
VDDPDGESSIETLVNVGLLPPVTISAVDSGLGRVTVSWDPGELLPGSLITGFRVWWGPEDQPFDSSEDVLDPLAREHELTDVTCDATLDFTVQVIAGYPDPATGITRTYETTIERGSPLEWTDQWTDPANWTVHTYPAIVRLYVPPCTCTGDEDCDDGAYCNGEERCVDDRCQDGVEPCPDPGAECIEADDLCREIDCTDTVDNDADTLTDCDDGEDCGDDPSCCPVGDTAPCPVRGLHLTRNPPELRFDWTPPPSDRCFAHQYLFEAVEDFAMLPPHAASDNANFVPVILLPAAASSHASVEDAVAPPELRYYLIAPIGPDGSMGCLEHYGFDSRCDPGCL